jgi:hypothetical protein
MGIGNTLGRYVKYFEATKQRKYTSYAQICIYMDILKALQGSISLEYLDDDWNEMMDYEHIPFHCRKCHEHNDLFCDCPMNVHNPKAREGKKKEGYTTLTKKKRHPHIKKTQ